MSGALQALYQNHRSFAPADSNAVYFGGGSTTQVAAYGWSGSGYGTKFSDPATGFTLARGCTVSPDKSVLAVGADASPWIHAYPVTSSAFGTKHTDPGSQPTSTVYLPSFNSAGNVLAMAQAGTPYTAAYIWSSGFSTRYSNPASLPADSSYTSGWNPAGTALGIGGAVQAGGASVYLWSSGYSTKYAAPASPTGGGYGVKWLPDGNTITTNNSGTPYIHAFAWSGSGWGTKYANPSTLASQPQQCIAVLSNAIFSGSPYTPYIIGWAFSGGFGSKYSDPSTLPTGGCEWGISFSQSGSNVVVSNTTSTYQAAYPFSAGFGTKYANPSSAMASATRGASFN